MPWLSRSAITQIWNRTWPGQATCVHVQSHIEPGTCVHVLSLVKLMKSYGTGYMRTPPGSTSDCPGPFVSHCVVSPLHLAVITAISRVGRDYRLSLVSLHSKLLSVQQQSLACWAFCAAAKSGVLGMATWHILSLRVFTAAACIYSSMVQTFRAGRVRHNSVFYY